MSNNWFQFKKFKIFQEKAAMKVGVDSVLLGSLASFDKPDKILDIGAGTGLLSFMAEQRTKADVTAVEINKEAYEQCLENIKYNTKDDKINAIHTSFQDFSLNCVTKFDHIISNPPYFNNSYSSSDKARNIARQNNNLSSEELFKGAIDLLSHEGVFSIIIPYTYVEEYMQLSDQNNICCFSKIEISPKEGKNPNRCILEFSLTVKEQIKRNVFVRDSQTGDYTSDYKAVTKDFYL